MSVQPRFNIGQPVWYTYKKTKSSERKRTFLFVVHDIGIEIGPGDDPENLSKEEVQILYTIRDLLAVADGIKIDEVADEAELSPVEADRPTKDDVVFMPFDEEDEPPPSWYIGRAWVVKYEDKYEVCARCVSGSYHEFGKFPLEEALRVAHEHRQGFKCDCARLLNREPKHPGRR